ncbi:MAG: sn-glycerol-3-phosphate ABC transporter ATP-binding protein UgpC [Roseitalea porphyridii]
MVHVALKNISKVYPNGVRAVQPTSFNIDKGEFIVLVGPSGCGKSTLLRMIAGLEEITEGELSIAGRVVNDVDPAERDIAMVFQNYALYPHMSVYKNLAYGLKNRGTPKEEIDRKVREAAKLLQIGDFLERKPSQLSGGQRQRVAMGRAIVRDPSIFLFDEPLSNLDAKLRNQMRLEIKRLQRRLETAAIYVTHDQVEAMTLADRIVVLNQGEVEQIGTPAEVYSNPASVFVASFIGAPPMNLLEAQTEDGGLRIGDARIEAPVRANGPVTLGIRPERAHFANGGDAPGPMMTVDTVEELGAVRLVHGTVGGQHFTANQSADEPPPDGAVPLRLRGEDLHLFDHGSGRRL